MRPEASVYGYARVSTKEQNLDRQLFELKKYVKEEFIVTDKSSGKDTQREGYRALKGTLGLRPGDTLYVVSLDRLSRNKEDIKRELEWFKSNNIRLKILDLPTSLIDLPDGQQWMQDMITNILVEVLASMAEQERLIIRKRQADGIAAAKAKGKHLGRPRLVRPEHFELYYCKWRSGEITAKKAMTALGLSSSSFYKMVKQYEREISTKA